MRLFLRNTSKLQLVLYSEVVEKSYFCYVTKKTVKTNEMNIVL